MILELENQNSPVFDKIIDMVKRCPDIVYMKIKDTPTLSLLGLGIYTSKRKIYRKVWVRIHSTMKATLSDVISAICGKNFMRQKGRRAFYDPMRKGDSVLL